MEQRFQTWWKYVIAFAIGSGLTFAGFAGVNDLERGPLAPAAGAVALNSIDLNFIYLNGSPAIFGSSPQQGCQNCPMMLVGGTYPTFWIRANSTTVDVPIAFWINISSPIPFGVFACGYNGPVPPVGWPHCPYATTWLSGESIVEVGGLSLGVSLTIAVPDPAPAFPSGFDMQATITVWTSPPG
jgi:hypothetical protein